MKILFYNHTGLVSGAEHMLLLILGRLDRRKFEPVVACPPEGELAARAAALGAAVEPVGELNARFTTRPDLLFGYLVSFARTIAGFRRLVRRERPALVHANSTRAGLVATAATFGMRETRVVWHLHDVLPAHPVSALIRLFALLFSRRIALLAVSRAVAEAFRGSVDARRFDLAVIHNGIETDRFERDADGARKLRAELGIGPGAIAFGIAGQLTPRKGQLELIYAFAGVAGQIPDSRLLIVGAAIFNQDAEYEKELRYAAQLCGLKERVIFLGRRADMAAVFSALDVLVLNSRNEPFGLVLVEAMTAGTPVLSTAVDGVPEFVTHGETGWLVPPGERDALGTALVTLAGDAKLRARLAAAGRRHARESFGAERYGAAVEDFFARLAAHDIKRSAAAEAAGEELAGAENPAAVKS